MNQPPPPQQQFPPQMAMPMQMPPQQQQQQQQLPPPVLPYSRAWHITKIMFHTLALVFSIVAVGLSASLINYFYYESYIIIWTAPQAVISICWSVAELITVCVRRAHKGIHPGAHVALHLLLWLGFAAACGLNGFFLGYALIDDYSYYYGYGSRYDSYSTYTGLMQGVVAMCALLFLIHFFLFVRACIETHRRNSSPRVVMMPQPMYYPPPQQPYPMQQQQYPQQHVPYPMHPQQAHFSGHWEPPKEVQRHMTGSSTGQTGQTGHTGQVSQPTNYAGSPIREDGLHPAQPQQTHQ
jgi:uncharacterized membrane protein YhaH (DUF805 family)